MKSLPKMVLAALFTGLMVAGALITIPFPEVPMVIANAFPWLAALILGPVWGAVSTGLYLLLGAFGLPVFAKGAAGVGVLFGTTGGFLFGYLVSALVVGWLRDPEAKSVVRTTLAVLAGALTVYLIGVPWLSFVVFKGAAGFETENLLKALAWGTGSATFPLLFVWGDLIKVAAVVAVGTVVAKLPGVSDLQKK